MKGKKGGLVNARLFSGIHKRAYVMARFGSGRRRQAWVNDFHEELVE